MKRRWLRRDLLTSILVNPAYGKKSNKGTDLIEFPGTLLDIPLFVFPKIRSFAQIYTSGFPLVVLVLIIPVWVLLSCCLCFIGKGGKIFSFNVISEVCGCLKLPTMDKRKQSSSGQNVGLFIGQSTKKVVEEEGEEEEEVGIDTVSKAFITLEKMADGEHRYTVDEALLATGFGKYQYLILFYAGMGWVSEAMEMMLLSFVGPAVQDEWGLTSQQDSLITTVVFAGMLIGAYSWGLVSDRFGRRRGFLVTATITSAAGLMSAFAPNYAALITARFFVGLGVGGGHVLLSWFLEFVPATNRGAWLVIFSAFWTVGTIFEAGLAWYIMPKLGWRWLLGLCALPSFLLLLFYHKTPESPRYLCLKGRKNSAVKVLEKIAELNGKELPLGILASDHEIEMKKNLPQEGGNALSIGDQAPAPAAPSKWKDSNMGPIKSLLTLLSPKLMRSTFLLWIVFFGNAFSYYGLVLLTTELNKGHGHCNHQTKKSNDVNYKEVFITSFAEFPGLILSAFIVDKLGRKISMAGMFFLGCISMLPLVVHQSSILTTICLFGARICITGTFTVVYIYAPEIYPTSVRSTGLGVASSMGRIGGMLCPLVAVGLVQGCHQTAAVVLFIGIIFASGVAVLLFPFETKGRQLTDSVCSTKNDKVMDEEQGQLRI